MEKSFCLQDLSRLKWQLEIGPAEFDQDVTRHRCLYEEARHDRNCAAHINRTIALPEARVVKQWTSV